MNATKKPAKKTRSLLPKGYLRDLLAERGFTQVEPGALETMSRGLEVKLREYALARLALLRAGQKKASTNARLTGTQARYCFQTSAHHALANPAGLAEDGVA